MAYEHFYRYYDRLMDDVPYDQYIDLVRSLVKPGSHLLDVGCGTGKVLLPLIKEGYVVDGLDKSEDMLLILQDKLVDENVSAQLFCDDMQHVNVDSYYDLIYSFIDTINYLTDQSALTQTIQGIYHSLKPGGIFLFDIHNKHYIEDVFNDYSYHDQFPDFSYLWDTYLDVSDEKTNLFHALTFFIRNSDGKYERYDEEHHQVVFPLERYRSLLKSVGFTSIDTLSDFQPDLDMSASKFQLICRKLA